MNDINIIVADSPFISIRKVCFNVTKNVPDTFVRFAYYLARKRIKKIAKFDPKLLDQKVLVK
jgi:hypothetical protein